MQVVYPALVDSLSNAEKDALFSLLADQTFITLCDSHLAMFQKDIAELEPDVEDFVTKYRELQSCCFLWRGLKEYAIEVRETLKLKEELR